jgi:hypothetical protein
MGFRVAGLRVTERADGCIRVIAIMAYVRIVMDYDG